MDRTRRRVLSRLRKMQIEKLENRWVMNATWQNPLVPTDVNSDEWVSPMDALLIINRLNSRNGENEPPGLGTVRLAGEPYYDVNGDSFLSPIDALLVINKLDAQTPLLFATLATDTQLGGGVNDDRITSDASIRGRTQFALPRDTLFVGWDIATDNDLKNVSHLRVDNQFEISATQVNDLLGAPLSEGSHRLTVVLRRGSAELGRFTFEFIFNSNEK